MKLAIAIRLYIKEKLTLGKAAELAGLSRYEFEESLTDNGIPISNLTFEDILKDIKKIN